jgi:hypothetical protein
MRVERRTELESPRLARSDTRIARGRSKSEYMPGRRYDVRLDHDVEIVVFDSDREALGPNVFVDKKFTGPDVELPAVPGATDQLACPIIDEFRPVRLLRGSANRTFTKRGALVGANVQKGVKPVVQPEEAH